MYIGCLYFENRLCKSFNWITKFEFVRLRDTIVVWRLDRLGGNMEDLITLFNELNERGVT